MEEKQTSLQEVVVVAIPFESFYSLYPRRVSRKDAERAWLRLTEQQRFAAVESLPTHIRYWEATGTTKEFLPYPASWLNGERWTDELEIPQSKAPDDWMRSKEGIEQKARDVGCWPARANEDWHSLKARILLKIAA